MLIYYVIIETFILTLSRLHIFAIYVCKYVKKEEALGFIMVKRFFKTGN